MSNDALAVVITGASSGIGEAIAYEYAKKGARVGLFARRRERLEAVAERCRELGASEAHVLAGDTTVADDVERAIRELDSAWGRIDRAYLNAGGYGEPTHGSLSKTRDIDWSAADFSAASAERVMRANYLGAVLWLEPVLRMMSARGSGTIAVMGAMAADRGHPRHGPYAASKAALRALCDAMRADARRHGVHLCLIEPGCVVSGLTEAECCARMPFLQPTDVAVRRFVRGVEARERVIRFPVRASLFSRFVAALPRPLFDVWSQTQLPELPTQSRSLQSPPETPSSS